jgi:hypothetical protein
MVLDLFDGKFFTYYDSFGNPANGYYHGVHVRLIRKLNDMCPNGKMGTYLRRWSRLERWYSIRLPLAFLLCTIRTGNLPYQR